MVAKKREGFLCIELNNKVRQTIEMVGVLYSKHLLPTKTLDKPSIINSTVPTSKSSTNAIKSLNPNSPLQQLHSHNEHLLQDINKLKIQ